MPKKAYKRKFEKAVEVKPPAHVAKAICNEHTLSDFFNGPHCTMRNLQAAVELEKTGKNRPSILKRLVGRIGTLERRSRYDELELE